MIRASDRHESSLSRSLFAKRTLIIFDLQPVLRLYAVPMTAFVAEEEDEDAFDGDDGDDV